MWVWVGSDLKIKVLSTPTQADSGLQGENWLCRPWQQTQRRPVPYLSWTQCLVEHRWVPLYTNFEFSMRFNTGKIGTDAPWFFRINWEFGLSKFGLNGTTCIRCTVCENGLFALERSICAGPWVESHFSDNSYVSSKFWGGGFKTMPTVQILMGRSSNYAKRIPGEKNFQFYGRLPPTIALFLASNKSTSLGVTFAAL